MSTEYNKAILYYLLNSEGATSGKQLAAVFSMSENTIRREITQINDYLTDYGCSVSARKASGYSVSIHDRELAYPFLKRFRYDYKRLSYTDDQELASRKIIRVLLVAERPVTVEELADICWCSRSTILRRMESVTNQLRDYQLTLRRSSEGLRVQGGEWQKRQALIYAHKLYMHDADYDENFQAMFTIPDDPGIYETVRTAFVSYIQDNEYAIPYVDIPKIANYLILCVTRQRHAGELKFSTEQMSTIQKHKMYSFAQGFVETLPAWFRRQLSESDIMGLAILLLCYKAVRRVERNHSAEYSEMRMVAQDFLQYLRRNYLFSCDFDEELLSAVSDYFYLLHYRLLFDVCVDEEIGQYPARKSIITMELCDLFVQYYEETFHRKLSRTNAMGAYIIFQTFATGHSLNKFFFRGLIASIYGVSTASYIREKLNKQFPCSFSCLDTADLSDLSNLPLANYDILFTDYYPADGSFPYVVAIPFDLDKRGRFPSLRRYFNYITSNRILTAFNREHIHYTNLSRKADVLDYLYQLFEGTVPSRENFERVILTRDMRLNWVLWNKVVYIDGSELLQKTSLNVLVNDRPFSWNGRECQVVVFYSRSNDLYENALLNSMLDKLEKAHGTDFDELEQILFQYQLDDNYAEQAIPG